MAEIVFRPDAGLCVRMKTGKRIGEYRLSRARLLGADAAVQFEKLGPDGKVEAVYLVVQRGGVWRCPCDDHAYRPARRGRCKHCVCAEELAPALAAGALVLPERMRRERA